MATTQERRRDGLIKHAWYRYNADTRHLSSTDPDYRAKERRAWQSLQRALKAIR